MMHSLKPSIAIALLLAATGLAQAACPPLAQGDTAEVLASNQQRLICLNREIQDAADDRQLDLQFKMLNNSVKAQDIQRRFDNLPVYVPPKF